MDTIAVVIIATRGVDGNSKNQKRQVKGEAPEHYWSGDCRGTADSQELKERSLEIMLLTKVTSWFNPTLVPRSLGDADEGLLPLGPVRACRH